MEEEIKKSEEQTSEMEIKEAQTEEIQSDEVKEEDESPREKTKRDFYIEVVLFLILGVLIGIAVKTEAYKKVTIGFDDYKMKLKKQDYNINKLQTDLAKTAAEQAPTDEQNAPAEGGNVEEQPQGGAALQDSGQNNPVDEGSAPVENGSQGSAN